MPNVSFIRQELKNVTKQYDLIRDCVAGEQQIKFRKTKYLPQPNPDDESQENQDRYESYLTRAVFYNVTKRTLAGLLGTVFFREPVVTVPTVLDFIKSDADGGGVTLDQIAKRGVEYTLQFGRGGIYSDYPTAGVAASKAEIDKGNLRPTITVYDPKNIINWRTVGRGGKKLLSLVVLAEQYVSFDDGFEQKLDTQYRVLSLQDGLYQVDVYRAVGGGFAVAETYQPTDFNGIRLDFIPFSFLGATDNDPSVDAPPLYDLAALNIAHYRNSADYEESCYMVGQPTAYFAGLTEEWVENVMGGAVMLGSRGAVALPENGSAGLLQAQPNTMPKEAMEAKERQMVALGAKLVEQKTVQRTATEADIENSSELSTLASVAQNVAAAVKLALQWCGLFVGNTNEADIDFKLNTEFDLTKMSPDERRQLLAEWMGGGITFSEYRNNLRRAGIATLDDEEAKTEIANDLATAPNLTDPNAQGGNNA